MKNVRLIHYLLINPLYIDKGVWQQSFNVCIQRDAIIGSNCKLAICHFYAICVKRFLLKPYKQFPFEIAPNLISFEIFELLILNLWNEKYLSLIWNDKFVSSNILSFNLYRNLNTSESHDSYQRSLLNFVNAISLFL